jgi:L-aminopeptidase/D-esterase-like protein
VAQGNVGAGTGATAGKWEGGLRTKGGLGTASLDLGDGLVVGALAVVNPRGDLLHPATRRLYAVHGGFDTATGERVRERESARASDGGAGENTTIAVVATNARLTKSQLARVARMADDGLARAIRPVHTTGDGDLIFALSVPADGREILPTSPNAASDLIGTAAADVMVHAILNAARAATSIPGFPAIRELLTG